jgi:hypothetical protein
MSSIVNNAQKEVQMENKIAGVKKRSANAWVSKYVMEFALLARKLRKGNKDANGNPDKYTARIERELGKVDAAIEMLEEDPTWALELGESGAEIEDVLEFLERKAAEELANDRTKVATDKVKKTLPQYRVQQSQQAAAMIPRAAQ